MNWRNVQIFGFRAYRPEKSHLITALLILAACGIGIWILLSDGENPVVESPTAASGAATALPLEESTQQTEQTTEQTQEIQQQETPPEQQEEQKQFFEYGGKCASDVKDAEDDVNDVTTYLTQYQQEHGTLEQQYQTKKAEYEALLAQLEQEYTPQSSRLQEKIRGAEQDLQRVQEKLGQVRAVCEPPQ